MSDFLGPTLWMSICSCTECNGDGKLLVHVCMCDRQCSQRLSYAGSCSVSPLCLRALQLSEGEFLHCPQHEIDKKMWQQQVQHLSHILKAVHAVRQYTIACCTFAMYVWTPLVLEVKRCASCS